MDYFYRRLSGEGSEDDEASNSLFNVAIATIFAREVLEGCIIIGQYRTVIQKDDNMSPARQSELLRIVTRAASIAAMVAVLVVIAIAVPLAVLGNELDDFVVELIEGCSKVVAAFAIIQLSVKIPVWLGLYKKVSLLPWKKYDHNKHKASLDGNLSNKEVYFNVSWNIWREVAECGVFLIPFFLGSELKAIPVSAVVGSAVALVLGAGIYVANNRMTQKFWLAMTMSGLTLFLSVGLFVGGCHEFEEALGETRKVWVIKNSAFSHKEFPFVLVKPFGYSSSRTVLQITTFWLWLSLGLFLHFVKYQRSKNIRQQYPDEISKEVESSSEGTNYEDGMNVDDIEVGPLETGALGGDEAEA